MAEPKSDILQQLVSITSDQKPFAVMGLDTIGKDDSREIFHVVVQNFAYNNAVNQYKEKSRLELMQKCSQEIPQSDLERFGISDTYASSALESMEFSNKLTAFVVEELDDSLLIVNGNDSVVSSLTKVNGCESLYADKAEQGLAMNSSNLIGAYMQEHDASGDTPRSYLKYIKAEKVNATTCDEKIAAVSSLIGQCCEEYSISAEKTAPVAESAGQENIFENELSELAAATENTFDDFLKEFHAEQPSAKEEEPVAEMPPKQKVYHIEMDFTPEQQAVLDGMKKQEDEIHEAWVEKGKKTYREGTIEQKLGILKKTGIVTDKTEDLTVLREMYQMLDRECGDGDGKKNNGFTVLQAGTTGLQAGNRVTQVAFATYDIDETGMVKIAGFSRLVCADMEYVQKAEQIAQTGGFDTFAHGGIDLEKYKALCEAGVSNKAEKFCTITALGNAIAKYFESYPVSQYPIVSAGMANRIKDIPEKYRKTVSYSQGALLQSINNESLTIEPIDFAQFIKEYTAAALTAEEYKGENVLFPGKTPPDNLKNFGLDAIAEQNGKDITGAVAKCAFMAEMIGNIYQQHLEMEKSRELTGHAEARIRAIQERHDRAVQRKEESGFQEESFRKPENQELSPVPPEDALQEQSQNNTLNQKIAGISEMAQKFMAEISQPAPAPAEHIEQPSPVSAEHTDRLYDSLNKVSSAMAENNVAVQVLAHRLTVQNANNSQTNENIGQLIATLNTMITTLQENMQTQKEESRAVIGALEKKIQVQEEQIKAQKEENAQLLATVKQLAEVAVQTQGQFIDVNERISQTQEQNTHMIENQNTYALATSTLVKEVASVKADGADTRESLASFRQETRDSFDRTNQTFAQYSTTLQHYGTEIANIKTATRENTAEIKRVRSEFSKRFSFIAQNSAAMAEIAKKQSGQLELLGKNQNELASGFVELHDRVTVIDTKLTKRMPNMEYHKDVIEEDEDMAYDDIKYPAYPPVDYTRNEYNERY